MSKARAPSATSERLGAEDWERAALKALAESGVAGVAVEPLARRLGVTKGSFYWHYEDREALLRAALARWEHDYTERVIEILEALPGARERLIRLIGDTSMVRSSGKIHVALGAASGIPAVAAAMARVAKRRIAYLERCYTELGLSRSDARRSALLAYSAYVGLIHLRAEAPNEIPGGDELSAYTARVVDALVPASRERRRS